MRPKLPQGELPATMSTREQLESLIGSAVDAGYRIGFSFAARERSENAILKARVKALESRSTSFTRYLPSIPFAFGALIACLGLALIIDEFSRANGIVIFIGLLGLILGLSLRDK
jgi:hypothetical protein